MARALQDWGARLDVSAYRDAAVYFLGGEAVVVHQVPVRSDHGVLGRQKVCLLSDDVAFSITAAVHSPGAVLEHQRRFLRHTDLRAIQWINLSGQTATLYTIERQ